MCHGKINHKSESLKIDRHLLRLIPLYQNVTKIPAKPNVCVVLTAGLAVQHSQPPHYQHRRPDIPGIPPALRPKWK